MVLGKKEMYVNIGCGHNAPKEWTNFDCIITVRLENVSIFGSLIKDLINLRTSYPKNIIYGNIVKGLPIKKNSCKGIYCSHLLEHLSVQDFRTSLKNIYSYLADDGIFRCVIPDMYAYAKEYVEKREKGDIDACFYMIHDLRIGMMESRTWWKWVGLWFYTDRHYWMWDRDSLYVELLLSGFTRIRECNFMETEDDMFKMLDNEGRFSKAICFEARK